MKQSKKFKGQKGFTLVEVIVVAIIVAALAAVAVPMYTSYVDSSRVNAAANAAGSVASFMGACINQRGEVAGISADDTTDGTANITLGCVAANGTDTLSRMQLPTGIKFAVSAVDTNGSVSAQHVESDKNMTYNY